jgi:hypothetical protein
MSGKFSKVRDVATRLIAPLIVIFFVATYFIEASYPASISMTGGPRGPEWIYEVRLLNGLLILVFSLLSLPRWQAFAGLLSLVIFAYLHRGI